MKFIGRDPLIDHTNGLRCTTLVSTPFDENPSADHWPRGIQVGKTGQVTRRGNGHLAKHHRSAEGLRAIGALL